MMEGIMAPVDKNACNVLYVLGVVLFVMALITLVTGIVSVLADGSIKGNMKIYIMVIVLLNTFMLGLSYYIYRTLYTICLKVL